MPDAKNNAKLTGDTHLPETESELPLQEGSDNAPGEESSAGGRGRATELGMEGKPGRGINQAGLLKDKDEGTDDPAGSRTSEAGDKQPKSQDR